jgi:superfamily I DNA/RNA helicase
MADGIEFTSAQRALVDTVSSLYVEACPGAGKTHAIVQRYLERPVRHPRKGVALISFTNAATDEARRRAGNVAELLRVPNFIGTIDAFINRFLVGPSMLAQSGVSPMFRANWSSVPNAQITGGGQCQPTLDHFVIEGGVARLDGKTLSWQQRRAAEGLPRWQLENLEKNALRQWKRLVMGGTVTASASRVLLRGYLADPRRRGQLSDLVAARFSEAIVDEVQDCCEEDILVLELLRDAGVGLVVVGDPDQAIYGFRTGSPHHLAEFVGKLPQGERLDGNFRSSPGICSIVDRLRASSNRTDHAVGPRKSLQTPVAVMRFDKEQELPDKLTALCAERDIELERTVVLAHATKTARLSAGGGDEYKLGAGKLAHLAKAFYDVCDVRSTATSRSHALGSIGRILRELGPHEELHEAAYLAEMGLTEREFSEECLRLATATPNPYDDPPSAFKAALIAATGSQERLGWRTSGLRTPKDDIWPGQPTDSGAVLRYSTVHSYKGLQEHSVVLVIPERSNEQPDGGLFLWTNGTEGENRRVLYVGASRAEALLVLAAHADVYDTVRSNLDRHGVPFEEV